MTTEVQYSSNGEKWFVTVDGFGGLVYDDDASGWYDAVYPSFNGYRELKDSSGNSWYMIADGFGSFTLSDTTPTTSDSWVDETYETVITKAETGTSGNIKYLILTKDSATWYVYPDGWGSLTITETEP